MSEAKHHWLVAGQVVVSHKTKGTRNRTMNVMIQTDEKILTKFSIATAQDALIRRFYTESAQERGFEIVDVVIIGINYLGEMTDEVFNGQFDQAMAAETIQKAMVN